MEDMGRYTCEISGIKTEAFLTVEGYTQQILIISLGTVDIIQSLTCSFLKITEADPVYTFLRPLNKKYEGYNNREVELECTVSSGRAMVTWYKDDKPLKDGDEYDISKDATGNCRLIIKKGNPKHAGKISCRIDKQKDETVTQLNMSDWPYRFTRQLLGVHSTEKDYVCMECELDEEDGEVQWFKDGEPLKGDKRLD